MDRIRQLDTTTLVLSWINAVEVYYQLERRDGRAAADGVLDRLRRVVELDLPDPALMVEAARLKTVHAMALGDCFAVATAAARGIPLLTGDPEILGARDLPCEVEDLRPGAGGRDPG